MSDLLAFLNAQLLADGAPAGFSGIVSVGVRGIGPNGTTVWWNAECASHRATRIWTGSESVSFDVGIGVDEETAAWIVGSRPKPGSLRLISGDRKLLSRFLDRFFRPAGTIAARLWSTDR